MRTLIRRTLLWGPAALLLAAVAAYLIVPWPVRMRWSDPETTSFMRYRVAQAEARGETLALRQEWRRLEDISPNVVRAVIVAEDGRFREHRGVDWAALGEEVRWDGGSPLSWTNPDDLRALVRAALYYREHKDELRGRSTITQQLAKNLYFTPERSLPRKVAELLVAQRLEWFLTKDRILELYLNTVELGPGLFGVEAAAREYFGRSAAELTAFQAASLAGTLPHPLTSNPSRSPARMAWRRDLILDRLGGRAVVSSPVPEAPEPDGPEAATLRTAPDLGGVVEPAPAAAALGEPVGDSLGVLLLQPTGRPDPDGPGDPTPDAGAPVPAPAQPDTVVVTP